MISTMNSSMSMSQTSSNQKIDLLNQKTKKKTQTKIEKAIVKSNQRKSFKFEHVKINQRDKIIRDRFRDRFSKRKKNEKRDRDSKKFKKHQNQNISSKNIEQIVTNQFIQKNRKKSIERIEKIEIKNERISRATTHAFTIKINDDEINDDEFNEFNENQKFDEK